MKLRGNQETITIYAPTSGGRSYTIYTRSKMIHSFEKYVTRDLESLQKFSGIRSRLMIPRVIVLWMHQLSAVYDPWFAFYDKFR